MGRLLPASLVAVALSMLCAGAARAASCSECAPWWHLIATPVPTTLQTHPGVGGAEVQEIVTGPFTEGGSLAFDVSVAHVSLGSFARGAKVAEGTPEATAANLQAALETAYGKGNVTVTGGPAGSEALLIRTATTVPMVEVQAEAGEAKAAIVSGGGSDGEIVVTAVDVGDANVAPASQKVTLSETLPPGLEAVGVTARAGEVLGAEASDPAANPLECSFTALSCTYDGHTALAELPPFVPIEMRVEVVVLPGANSGEPVHAAIVGGGAPPASVERAAPIGTQPAFGVSDFELRSEGPGGRPDAQAGSHPFQLSATVMFDESSPFDSVGLAKDARIKLPPGLLGTAAAVPRCSMAAFLTSPSGGIGEGTRCDPQTAVGVARIDVNPEAVVAPGSAAVALFNLEPAVGEPARFGFEVADVPVILDTSIPVDGAYGVVLSISNITQAVDLDGAEITFWGVPGDSRHDLSRGAGCLEGGPEGCNPTRAVNPPPLLTLPTACSSPLQATSEIDSWSEPGAYRSYALQTPLGPVEGCDRLQFQPSLTVVPERRAASTPTGLTLDVHVPQAVGMSVEGLAEADAKSVTIAFPRGLTLDPSTGDGLASCTEAMFALGSESHPSCPEASKLALVKVTSPLLGGSLEGAAYLAQQNQNPFGSLLALYVVAEEPIGGVQVKLAGDVTLDPGTGQLLATFSLPQLPFEDLQISFFGGDRAPLATPARCGAYVTSASLAPWSGSEAVERFATFEVVTGSGGAPCPGATLPLTAKLTGGSTNIDAGHATSFTATVSRGDGDQAIAGIELHMPAGLAAFLKDVAPCGEREANEGQCGAGAMIGEDTVSAGLGADPVSVAGKIYLTGPYHGAPFGISIVNPVRLGPLDLAHDTSNPASDPACDCVVIRGRLAVDPRTGALTMTTNRADEGHAIPSIVDGVPLDLEQVNVTLDRPGFIVNPTSCAPSSLQATIMGQEGAALAGSAHFQLANCALLHFTPKVSASLAAHASLATGASMRLKVVYPKTGITSQSRLQQVELALPRGLALRLGALQGACPALVFETERQNCPRASRVGRAVAHTPILPAPLTGPIYFVSGGSARFPQDVIVLQGSGVTLEMHGATSLSREGAMSVTFGDLPDLPVESLEVVLPAGEHAQLGANLPHEAQDFCGHVLRASLLLKAWNGLKAARKITIAVNGCPRRSASVRPVRGRRGASASRPAARPRT